MTEAARTVWLTTANVRARFASDDGRPLHWCVLRALIDLTPDDEGVVFVNYGTPQRPRFKWDEARVDEWFRRACRWRSSSGEERSTRSGGGTQTGAPGAAASTQPRKRARSNLRSRTRFQRVDAGSPKTLINRLLSEIR